MDRFIATHMICDKMAPDAPMSAPTTVSSCEPRTKPSAHSAQPDDELSTVMTTGGRARPTARVACIPRKAPTPPPVKRTAGVRRRRLKVAAVKKTLPQ